MPGLDGIFGCPAGWLACRGAQAVLQCLLCGFCFPALILPFVIFLLMMMMMLFFYLSCFVIDV